jgi:uncharacterized protein
MMMTKKNLVGRREEMKLLNRLYKSKEAEFLAIYGRRRVGKTFLITQYFKDKGIFFEITGSYSASEDEQIGNFHRQYCALFKQETQIEQPKTWKDAFNNLTKELKKISIDQKIILFFDELPWLASDKSGFLQALDHFWNLYWSRLDNLLLVVSGSAASWMINNILNNTGGLYGRLSAQLRLNPFTLAEVKEYFRSRGIDLTNKQICEIYMVTGGIPKYLSFVEPGMSSAQIIHKLCFTPQAPLLTEFHKLFHSLFHHSDVHIEIVKILAKKRQGMKRSELLKKAGLKTGGWSSEILRELEESGFVLIFPQTGKSIREPFYYLIDEYSLFYLNWIDEVKSIILHGLEKDYWIKKQSDPTWKSWSGFAFECLCLKHVFKIKEALGISAVSTTVSHWKSFENGKKEVEVDLVIDRADQCINLCEVKFYNSSFTVTKTYAKELLRKKGLFAEKSKSKKTLFTTLITPYGAKENANYFESVDNQINIDCLF